MKTTENALHTKKIMASYLSVGMQIVGRKCQLSNFRNTFKVKHVMVSSDGLFIYYKVDKVCPNFEPLNKTFKKHINDKITILNNGI